MNTFLKDIRFAIRSLLRRPGFTAAAVITLALGIGASTGMFTVVDAALLRGLPYKSPENLYHLFESTPQKQFAQREFSYPDYLDYQQNQVLEGVAGYAGGGAIMSGRGEPERVFAPAATANFFSVLGVDPILGRTFQPGEDKPGTPLVAVLTYSMWQRSFGGDRNIVGQSITLNGNPHTIVGVLPASFQFALRANDLWRIYQPTDNQRTRRSLHGTNLIGRLKSGVSVAQAQSELSLIAGRIEREHKESHAGAGLRLVPLQEQVVGQVKPILIVLLVAVGLVLLIACANVASLMLTRSLGRQKEVAICAALGAGRWRIIRQLLTESLLLSLVGGAVGLLIAYWGVNALVGILPEAQLNALPFLKTLRIDTTILLFSFGISVLTGIVFGLAPAIEASRPDLNEVLKEGGRQSSTGGHRLRSALVISEIALAVVLLVGSGLMMKSLLRLLESNVGFNPENVLTMTVGVPVAKYPDAPRQTIFYDQLKQRVESLPGITSAGTVDVPPLQGGNTTRFYVEGDPVPPPGQEIEANVRVVNDTYFQTLGVPIVAGRMFSDRDQPPPPPPANNQGANTQAPPPQGVVVIGKTLADKVFAGRNPVGRRLKYGSFPGSDEVIGVVSDIKIGGLDEALRPVIYYQFRRFPGPVTNLVVRTNVDANSLAAGIRNEAKAIEPDVAIFNVNDMERVIAQSPAAFMRRFPALIIGIFAGVALLLASVGIYGVVSYSVTQQTHYIGVRIALGAQASDILKMILKRGLVLALVGMTLGAAAAFGLMRLLRTLLFEVQPTDAATFAIVLITLFIVTLLACYIPARRATKVDPLTALRYE